MKKLCECLVVSVMPTNVNENCFSHGQKYIMETGLFRAIYLYLGLLYFYD